ncbi:MAG TPA: PQQ-binding-like beta-propeller repeat protein, partial [Gemmataceae bacterium]|nr:PQQ-binding-like beta-propeller repeat protein [Gemmataceae bacterium]
PGQADNWPRFRGPNGTGISHDKDIPAHWTAANVLWKVRMPGVGNSSPVVWGDRLFVQSSSSDGSERLLLCFNATTGKQLWSRSVPAARHSMHPKNTLASSTPATDGHAVYFSVWDGSHIQLMAYDFAGKQLWKRDLGPFQSQHGAGASPVVYDGRVFFADDQDGTATLFALDAGSGQILWEVPRRPFRACYSAPFMLHRTGEAKQLIVASTAGVTSYQPDSGKENWDWVWHFTGMPQRTVASPLYADGFIFANSGDGSGTRHMVALRLGSSGPTKVWENKRGLPYVPTMLALGHDLFWIHDQGIAGCTDANTGKAFWTTRLEPTSASPIVIDGKIYIISENGNVFVVAATERYQLLARNSVDEPVMATPAVADHRLFIRGKEHLFCIGKAR